MYKNFFLLIFFYFLSQNLFSKSVIVEGLSKFSIDDIQSITSVDIFSENLETDDINIILKELSSSDLIYEISYKEIDNYFTLTIIEGNIIDNIYI